MESESEVTAVRIEGVSGRRVIPALRKYPNLVKLEITEINLTEDEIRAIFASLAEMHVQELVLSFVDVVGGDLRTFFPFIAECHSLRELTIEYIPLRDPDVVYELLHLPLTILKLSDIGLNDRCAEKIALSMYQNRTPRILDIHTGERDYITAAGWHMIAKALVDNTSLVGLNTYGSDDAFAIMTPAIEQNDRLHFYTSFYEHQMYYVSASRTLRFEFDDYNGLTWEGCLRNLERLVFAHFPVEHHAFAPLIALDQNALYLETELPSLSSTVDRVLRDAVFNAGADDPNLKRWADGSMFVDEDGKWDPQQETIYDATYYEVKRMQGVDFDWIPDARVLYPFRDEVLKLAAPRPPAGALVHSADAEWQARLADAAGADVLVCVPDDAGAAVFETLTLRHAARNYAVAIVGNATSKTMGVAERYLTNARRIFTAPDVAGAIAIAEKHADRAVYTIRDLLVYRECLASDELLLAPDEADRVAMRCGFGPGNWARVARFPTVWTLPGVGVAPDAGRFLAYLDARLSPKSGAVHATAWPAREGAAFAARLRDFLVSPVHLAKIVRDANELVAAPVDAVVDALAALGIVHRVAGGPLLVVRGSRPDAIAALHARLLAHSSEYRMVAPRGDVIDFQHAGTRYTAEAAAGGVNVMDVDARQPAPPALRQALRADARAAAAAKRRAL